MKGLLVREDVEAVLDDLPLLCTMHDTLSSAAAQRAARLGWGNGLSMADALILQAFLDEEVTHVLRNYTVYRRSLCIFQHAQSQKSPFSEGWFIPHPDAGS
jgi:hypothetical protein